MPLVDFSQKGKEEARKKAKENEKNEADKRKAAIDDSRAKKEGKFGRLFGG